MFIAPVIVFQYVVRKKYRETIFYRLGLKWPDIKKKGEKEHRIWIHAVSLGETKGATHFLHLLKKSYPNSTLVFSTVTETGQNEAKKFGVKTFFLPLDFSPIMRKLVKLIDPDLFVLVETDFWWNLLSELEKSKTFIAVINGKLSLNSFKNFQKVPFFAKRLFNKINLFCLQSEVDQKRFSNLKVNHEKLKVCGNIKFDNQWVPQKNHRLIFPKSKRIVTIALTHENEEELILSTILEMESIVFLLAPRHPERFDKIKNLLRRKGVIFRTILEEGKENERVVLVDQMGVMDECYKRSVAVVMGGSFIRQVGGHNIYEAARHLIPVLYGPFMHNQESIMNSLKKHDIGEEILLCNLKKRLEECIYNPLPRVSIKVLEEEVRGASKRSLEFIKQSL